MFQDGQYSANGGSFPGGKRTIPNWFSHGIKEGSQSDIF